MPAVGAKQAIGWKRVIGPNLPFEATAGAAPQRHRSGHSCLPQHIDEPEVGSAEKGVARLSVLGSSLWHARDPEPLNHQLDFFRVTELDVVPDLLQRRVWPDREKLPGGGARARKIAKQSS